MDSSNRHRSFFWPIILIGVGIVWLLVNLNIIAAVNIESLFNLWPVILIVIGLDLLLGHRNAWVGAAVGVLTVAAVVGFLVYGPALGWTTASASDARVETFSTPLDKATSANYVFDLSSQHVSIHSLDNSSNLIEAVIGHTGTIDYAVTGTDRKSVYISQVSNPSSWFSFNLSLQNLTWDLALNPTVPASLTIDGGSGSVSADLSDLKLKSLIASMGSGSSEFVLPQSSQTYTATIESGSGSITVSLPSSTAMTLEMNSGSGSVNINLPSNAQVRVEVLDSGSGSLNIPSDLVHAGGSFDVQGTGTWQTSGYDTAASKILIRIAGRGSGSVNIR